MNETAARDAVTHALSRIAPEADLATVRPGERLRDALDLDSLDFLALIDALHEETGVDVPERDYPAVDTLDGLVAYLAAHTPATAG